MRVSESVSESESESEGKGHTLLYLHVCDVSIEKAIG